MTLHRDLDHSVVAGVLAGICAQLRVDPVIVRVAFVVLVVASGGLALLAYGIAWALIPAEGSRPAKDGDLDRARSTAVRRLPSGGRVAAGVGLLTLAALLAFRELGIWWSDALVWPLVLAASGATLLWWQMRSGSSEEPGPSAATATRVPPEVETAAAATERPSQSRFAELYRGGFGVALVVGAALLFLSANDALGAARDAAFTAIVVVLALALIAAPFLWRLGRNLASERAERIRSQERAELAAHLHDSVLQTLTLMQKRADDPRRSRRSRGARSESCAPGSSARTRSRRRELRVGAARGGGRRSRTTRGARSSVVAVGDCALDERSEAVVAAAREAITNAAKFAPDGGADLGLRRGRRTARSRSSCAIAAPASTPPAVPADRRGVRESIIGRMERHGGRRGDPLQLRARGPRSSSTRSARRAGDERLSSAPRVVIVDDHAMFRRGVRAELEGLRRRSRRGRGRGAGRAHDRAPSSPTWSCSTCTCPAAAGSR